MEGEKEMTAHERRQKFGQGQRMRRIEDKPREGQRIRRIEDKPREGQRIKRIEVGGIMDIRIKMIWG